MNNAVVEAIFIMTVIRSQANKPNWVRGMGCDMLRMVRGVRSITGMVGVGNWVSMRKERVARGIYAHKSDEPCRQNDEVVEEREINLRSEPSMDKTGDEVRRTPLACRGTIILARFPHVPKAQRHQPRA